MVIETLAFQVVPHVGEAEFLEADRQVQTRFFNTQPGLLRRTTARGHDGSWLVILLWRTETDADSAGRSWREHPLGVRFNSLLQETTLRRYTTLD